MTRLPSRAGWTVALALLALAATGCYREGIYLKEPLVQPLGTVDLPAAVQPVSLTRQDFIRDIETDRPKPIQRPLAISWINEERLGDLVRDYFTRTNLFQEVSATLPSEQLEQYVVLYPRVTLRQYIRPSLGGTLLTLGTGLLYNNVLGGSSLYRYVDCELTVEAETPSGRHVNTYYSSCSSEERLVTDGPDQLGPLVSLAFTRALGDVANQIALDNDLLGRALAPEMTVKGLTQPGRPRIDVRSPKSLVVRTRHIHVTGEVNGLRRPAELRWSLNEEDRGRVPLRETPGTSRRRFAFDASLPEGEARLRLTLYGKPQGNASPPELAVKEIPYLCVTRGPKVRERWAVVVGISRYAHSGSRFANLQYAAADAALFREFLAGPESGGFARDHVLCLLDEKATLQNLKRALFEFLAQAHKDDLVVIFFSGHGLPEPRSAQLFLLCHDSDPEHLASTAFPMYDVQTALSRFIKAERVLVYADACHAGGLSGDGNAKGSSYNPVHQYFQQLAQARGRLIFTASQKGELSFESEKYGGGHGAFTHFLVKGLRGGADGDSNRLITAEEIGKYVCQHVATSTRDRQHPRITGEYDRHLPLAWVERP